MNFHFYYKSLKKLKPLFIKSEVLLFLGLLIAGIIFLPLAVSHEKNWDEGINLIKALLVSRGYSLYSQIWSDQPPLFTWLLSLGLPWLGYSLFWPRIVVLIFSAVLLLTVFKIAQRHTGRTAALLAILTIISQSDFLLFGTAVMIGLPSISLAMVSMLLAIKASEEAPRKLSLFFWSGLLLASSIMIKLFTLYFAPITIFYIFLSRRDFFKSPWLKPIIIYLAGLILPLLIAAALIFPWPVDQLFLSHFSFRSGAVLELNNLGALNNFFFNNFLLVFFAFLGLLWGYEKRQSLVLLPLALVLTSAAFLAGHQPLWPHLFQLIAIPLGWLAAYGWALIIEQVRVFPKPKNSSEKSQKTAAVILLIPAIMILLTLIYNSWDNNRKNALLGIKIDPVIINFIKNYSQQSQPRCFFTDRPIYAFLTGLEVPPETAVLTAKRISNRQFDSTIFLKTIMKYRPELIFLERFKYLYQQNYLLKQYVQRHYIPHYFDSWEKNTVWIIKK